MAAFSSTLPRALKHRWRMAARHGRHRRKHGLIAVEGIKPIQEALRAGLTPTAVTAKDENTLYQLSFPETCPAYVSPQALSEVASTAGPLPAAALFDMPPTPPPPRHVRRALILDHIQHPGNAGALVRTALWFGVEHLIFYGGIDPWHPRLISGSAGAIFHISWQQATAPEPLTHFLQARRLPLFTAVMDGPPIDQIERPSAFALIVGNEGHGLSPHWNSEAARPVSIPACQPFESLNVAVAAAVILYHWRPC